MFQDERMRDVIISLTDLAPKWDGSPTGSYGSGFMIDHIPFRRCGKYKGTPSPKEIIQVKCTEPTPVGQYLFLHIPHNEHFTVCEVFAYGKPEKAPKWGALEINRAMNKMATQFGDSGGAPKLGTDFDFNPECCKSCIFKR